MQFTRAKLLALFAPLIAAQSQPNPFSIPDGGLSFTAGEATTVNWDPTTDGTVTIILRSGASSNLNTGVVVADEIDNSGSFTWTPDTDITRGSDYALQIVDDSDPTNVNYTPPFVIESDNTVASSTGVVTLGAPTAAVIPAPTTTLEPIDSASDSPSTTPAAASMSEMSASAESSMSSEMSMSDSMMSSMTAADSTMTATDSTMTATDSSTTTTNSAEATDDAGFQGEDSSDTSEDAAPRATAMVGLLGAVAVAAFAL